MILQIISASSAVFMFTMILEIPKQYIPYTAATGGLGWWVYLVVQNGGYSSMMAAFLSTLAVAFVSHILARVKKAPVTVFLVSGTLPAVPGTAIYRSVYYMIQNDSQKCTYYLMETLLIAAGIAMAITIMDSLFRLLMAYDKRRGKARS